MNLPLFSEMLAERRRQLGYSIRQASRVLRLREDVLIAFEEGDFEQMPKSGYAQGMISSYARYLGLDANEVVDAYTEDLEQYKREGRRARGSQRGGRDGQRKREGSRGTAQPYVASRGLLPTSGGPAGDMGSFATTRVHNRSDFYYPGEERDDPEELEQTRSRPYTNRSAVRSRRSYRSRSNRDGRDIQTLDMDGFDDDLRLGREARPYESASTRAGRRSTRAYSSSERPRVNRRSRTATARDRDERRRSRKGDQASRGVADLLFGSGSPRTAAIVVVAAVVILSFVLIFSVVSCVNQGTETARTVPVSDASVETKKQTASQQTSQADTEASAQSTNKTDTDAQKTDADAQKTEESPVSSKGEETSVSVSVADGAVTWLEVECDGKSDVAETVTGPWQKTYTVEDIISIQAGDTTAVSVVQNGRQVQFESMASGIGSVTIKGTKKSTGNNDRDSKKTDDESSGGSSAKTGNASNAADTQESAESNAYDAEGSTADGYGYDDDYGYETGY